jgi:uncharacterized protein (TIGR01777 family)
VAVAGASGLIGRALVEALNASGHDVVRLVRQVPAGPDEVRWDPSRPLDPDLLGGVEAAVNLAGAGVGDKRWTESYKRVLIDSRLQSTHTLATALALLNPKPKVLVNASAIGYYGEGGDTELTENSPPGNDFLAQLCVRWEAATAPAEKAGIRVVHARTGLVMTRHGGAFGRMFTIFNLGLGGRLGSGRQWWSPISLTDEVRALQFLIDAESISGPVNLTTPLPHTNADITACIGSTMKRPQLFTVPPFALRLALGEFGDEPLRSQRVLPEVLRKAQFKWEHWHLHAMIEATLAE